jgi:DNA replication regulator SLD3
MSSFAVQGGILMKLHIKPYPSSVYAKPQELLPLIVTSRLDMSLAYLDPIAKSSLSSSRLFSGNIKALDNSKWNQSSARSPAMLIARLISDGSIHVLEEVEQNVYACCKIGDWVQLESLRENAWAARTYNLHKEKDNMEAVYQPEILESKDALVLGEERHMSSKRKKLERSESIQMLMQRRPQSPPIPTPPPTDNLEPSLTIEGPGRVESVMEEQVTLQSECSPATILEIIKDQYLVALYTSKVCRLPLHLSTYHRC